MKTAHAQKTVYAKVGQDKIDGSTDRPASVQPAVVMDGQRSARVSRKTIRSKTVPASPTNAVPVQLWVKPIVKAELGRMAARDGLSVSATGAALLEEIIRQKLHVQQAATLETVLEKTIAKSHRALATRLAWLLVRIAFDTGQTRVLTTNILGRQEGMTEENLKEILATADKRTKANLTRRTPQLTELMRSVETWLLADDEEGDGRRRGG
jgi:hypothetical protein